MLSGQRVHETFFELLWTSKPLPLQPWHPYPQQVYYTGGAVGEGQVKFPAQTGMNVSPVASQTAEGVVTYAG